MRALLGGFTTRGKSFLAAGLTVGVIGLSLGERALLSVGMVLVVLPLFAALATGRTRYRIRCLRTITPSRVPAGQHATVSLRLENISRLPTGLLLAEDTVPYPLGTRPRFVLERIEQGGARELGYPIESGTRGHFTIGPLRVRVADAFGLVELSYSFAEHSSLVVTPAITPLPRATLAGSWHGEGSGRTRTASTAGEDDVVPRAYRDGDELRKVHWRSTARRGELMVRREEQRWRNRAVLLLDTRARAHAGTGAGSSFEYAVSAAASIGVHLARAGLEGQLATDQGAVGAHGTFEDVLLDSLAVIKTSRGTELTNGLDGIHGAAGSWSPWRAGSLQPRPASSPRAAATWGPRWHCCSRSLAGLPPLPMTGCRMRPTALPQSCGRPAGVRSRSAPKRRSALPGNSCITPPTCQPAVLGADSRPGHRNEPPVDGDRGHRHRPGVNLPVPAALR